MSFPVMIRITSSVRDGVRYKTPSGSASFEIFHIDTIKVVIKTGKQGTLITIPAQCFEDAPNFLRGKGWVKMYAVQGRLEEDTFDDFVKQYVSRSRAASYIAAILEKSGIVKIDRLPPRALVLTQYQRQDELNHTHNIS